MSRCLWIWILFRWRDLPTYRSRSSLWSTVDRMQFLYCTHHYSDPFKYIILRRSFDHTYVTFLLTRPSTIIFNESLGYISSKMTAQNILNFTIKRFFQTWICIRWISRSSSSMPRRLQYGFLLWWIWMSSNRRWCNMCRPECGAGCIYRICYPVILGFNATLLTLIL